MLKRIAFLTGMMAVSAWSGLALAQSRPATIEAKTGAPWKHNASATVFPDAIAGMPRAIVMDFSTDQWDVAGSYEMPGLATVLTVYVYQAAVQDAPLWFAEARVPIMTRQDRFGKVTEFAPPAAFVPSGDAVASGLRTTWSTDGPYRSTALAIAPLGRDWIMKIRLSSKEKDARELDALLTQVLLELKLPPAAGSAVAVPIRSCTTRLKPLKTASPMRNDGASALLGGLIPSMLTEESTKRGKANKGASPSAPFCRDEELSSQLNVYRRDDASEFYVLSTGDSGRAALAQRDELASLLAGSKGGATVYSVQFVVPGETTVYGNYDRLPPPSQLIEIVNAGKWKSRTARTTKGSNITINPDSMK